jgi:hypothetical protein
MPFLVVPESKLSALLPGFSCRVRTNVSSTKLNLLKTIHQLVNIEDDMRSVRNVYPVLGVEPVLIERLQFLEEAGHVDNAAAADNVDAAGVDEARGEDVKVVGDTIGDDGVSGVVTTLSAAAQLRFVGEDVGELALAFVAPLGAEDYCRRHVGGCCDESQRRLWR